MSGVTEHIVESEDAGRRLDRWLRERYPQLTQGRIEKLLRKGDIRIDGAKAKSNARLEEAAIIRVPPIAADTAKSKPKPVFSEDDRRYLEEHIIYQDEYLFVLNKPPGIPVQGGTGQKRHIDGMLSSMAKNGEVPRLVHRIDKDTSGLLLIARDGAAARVLTAAFKSKAARKTYWAACIGVPKPRSGTIKSLLVKAPGSHGEKMIAVSPEEAERFPDAKRSVTDFATVENAGSRASWVVFRPVTGRTHQLRVHAGLLDTPMIGDGKYGPSKEEAERKIQGALSRKLHLHARRISIPHPDGSGRILTLEASLPEHMAHCWALFDWDAERSDDELLLEQIGS